VDVVGCEVGSSVCGPVSFGVGALVSGSGLVGAEVGATVCAPVG